MKIKTLIKKLQELNPDDDAKILYFEGRGINKSPVTIPLLATEIRDNTIIAKPYNDKTQNGDIHKVVNAFLHRLTWQQKYKVYLNSEQWKQKRIKVLERDNYLCQSCLTNKATEVHHLSYRLVGAEPLFDLISVCKKCHEDITKGLKVNRKNDNKYIFGALSDWLVSRLPDVTYDNVSKIELEFGHDGPWSIGDKNE